MTKSPRLFAFLALAFSAGSAIAQQDNNTLIDLLVCKKIITPKEAECVRADLLKAKEKSSADKIKLSGPVTQLSLYGDIRLRHQYDNVDPQVLWDKERCEWVDPGHGDQRDRWRFRLRLNADFTLKDNWFGGVQLQTSQFNDSSNQTYDGGFQNYGIYISRAFVGWNATDYLTFVGGKQANPFYTTDLMWDPDINPSGMVETFKIHKLFSCGEQETTTLASDGKTVLSVTRSPIACPWTLTLICGQFFFDDNLEYNLPGYNTDAYLFSEQLVFTYKFCNDVKFTLAPAYTRYNSAQVNTIFNQQGFAQIINNSSTDGLPLGWGETRNLSLVQLPGDVSFRLCGLKMKLLWDGVYNTDGGRRINDTYVYPIRNKSGTIIDFDHVTSHIRRDNFAWLVGLQLGENVKKGDWAVFVNYRQVGLGAIDPNLNDSDWLVSRLNMAGWKAAIAYNFTDAVLAQLTGYTGDNLRKNLIGGQATNGAKVADANSIQVLQLDLNVKF